MAHRETKVVFAVPTFQSSIIIAISDNFKKLFKPEEIVLKAVTDEYATQKDHLKRVLAQVKLTALIAMDVKPEADIVAAYTAAGVPIILLDEEAAGVSSIATDNNLGGRIAGEYFISKGRKRIAVITGRTQVKGGYNAEQRLKGFQQALRFGKLSIPQGCTIEVPNYSREDGIEVMPMLLDAGVDAIFCAAGDNCALGLVTVAKERKVRIPEEIAIIGFDDLLIAQISTPKLTTIKQPLKEITDAAHKMAVEQRDEILHKPRRIIFKPELIVRQSA
jgi:LacI family transcriptional regulator